MTLPNNPADGQIVEDSTTKRQFIYSASTNSWSPTRQRFNLFDLSGVSTDLPSDILYKLLYDPGLGKYAPTKTKGGPYVEAIVKENLNQPPSSNDVEEPGTIWLTKTSIGIAGGIEHAYVAAYTNPGQTGTVWKKIGAEDGGEYERPALPVQGTAPSSPVLGSLWFDNSGGPIVKKYWDGSAWQTLL